MKKIRLYNPLPENFSITYDTNGDGNPLTYIFHAQEIEEFEPEVAEHIRNHLGYKIAMKNKGKGTFEIAYEKALQQINLEDTYGK